MISPNTILRERYRIIHELGHGGMGAVYLAMDETLSCEVAVKETFATNEEQRHAFRREAQLLANLSHPTLPRVMDHFTHDKGQFLVMQFVSGHDLATLLELREQPFAAAKVLDWADQVLDALEELHSSNPPIVHRDIKPANLKVTPRGRILLLDFGLAKGAAGQMSTAEVDSHGKSIYGYTPNYAPIEQIRGAGTDPRSDLYSLAATLWTLLTARVPPDAVTRMAEIGEGNRDPLPPAAELNSRVPASVSSALNRALAVNRNQRFDNAAEMRRALTVAREKDVERQTLPMEDMESASPIPPGVPQASTIRVPEATPTGAPPPASLAPTVRAEDREVEQPAPDVKTIHVDSRPEVPAFDPRPATPTIASFLPEAPPKKSWRGPAMIGAALGLLVVVGIGILVWRPWATSISNANTPVQNSEKASLSNANASTVPEGMVSVPGGTFMMGRNDGDEYEWPAHEVTVKPFFIDTYEVTNEDYEKFVKATNHKLPQGWTGGSFPAGDARKPVTGVTWDDANAYARSAGKRLPSEEEWEFAARGSDGRRYPWGNDWRKGMANANSAAIGMADVGAYHGASPFGAFDMAGNAWEWTNSDMRAYVGGKLPDPHPERDTKVLRGGSYRSNDQQATATYRFGWRAREEKSYAQAGFRCVKDPP